MPHHPFSLKTLTWQTASVMQENIKWTTYSRSPRICHIPLPKGTGPWSVCTMMDKRPSWVNKLYVWFEMDQNIGHYNSLKFTFTFGFTVRRVQGVSCSHEMSIMGESTYPKWPGLYFISSSLSNRWAVIQALWRRMRLLLWQVMKVTGVHLLKTFC